MNNEKKNEVALVIEGTLSLEDLANASEAFSRIINQLAKESDDEAHVEWVIKMVKTASIDIASYGKSDTASGEIAAKNASIRWPVLGEDILHGKLVNYSKPIRDGVTKLQEILCERVPAFRMRSDDVESRITKEIDLLAEHLTASASPVKSHAIGALTGEVVGLNRQHALSVSIFLPVWRVAVPCYLPNTEPNELSKYWNKVVEVMGVITRDAKGVPKSVTQVRAVNPVDVISPGEVSDAMGVIPSLKPDEGWWHAG